MNTERIRKLTINRDLAAQLVSELREEASRLTLSGHQHEISVRVGRECRSISVTKIDTHGNYSSRLVRGREMILLGVKKAYAVMIEAAEQRLAEIDAEIRGATQP